nr:hypothetical protein [uncultured Psychrobacter sp.]
MSYYNIEQTLEIFRKELPEPELPFDLPQLADLCRQGRLTPAFPYTRYIMEIVEDAAGDKYPERGTSQFYDGYLTHKNLVALLDNNCKSLKIYEAETFENGVCCKVALAANAFDWKCYERDENYNHSSMNDIYTVTRENLLFPSRQIQRYITSQHFSDLEAPKQQQIAELQEKIVELTNDNDSLKRQLTQQTDDPANDKELAPNSQVKVTHMLYAILKEHGYDLSPPKGKGVANDQIVAASKTYKSPVTRNFVANWLERAHQLDIDLNK